MSFSWIPYYTEFAEKLMAYRTDRKPLLKLIYDHIDVESTSYMHDEGGEHFTDIDPFSVFGIFNRGINTERRVRLTENFKRLLDIKADAPNDFEGIPVLSNLKGYFFGRKNDRSTGDIENLWKLFEKVINAQDFEDEYNVVIKQFGIKINITMGLFWIRPNDFLALDSTNQNYMKSRYGITLPKKSPKYAEYKDLLKSVKDMMNQGKIKENTFYELSANANANRTAASDDEQYAEELRLLRNRKNIVLYGAPGTGKTYMVPEIAVRLCDNGIFGDSSREAIMKRYNELKQEKRIVFTTFHQSMDYEDWLEGIKVVSDTEGEDPDESLNSSNQIRYEIVPGIFKQLCDNAGRHIVKDKHTSISNDATVWKVSLGGAKENPVRTECMKNGHIRIGWDYYGPNISDETDWSKHNKEGKHILKAFVYGMKIGDIVMSCYSNSTIDAIGVVTGDYEFDDSFKEYKRVRKVNWLLKGINENIVAINGGKTMVLGTVYKLKSISLDDVKNLLDKYKKPTIVERNTKPYVMVIDELNRGNVSKIFGELITLMEPDKRKGCENEESVTLPYSKKPFSIPNNVYIIATMNTADRSLGTLDYAIRRRFAFLACKPYSLAGEVDGFNEELFKKVSKLFISNYDKYCENGRNQDFKIERAKTLSEEYRPEEVWIGHSYFIMKKDEQGNDTTRDRLLYEIIPLLEEYVRDGVLTEEAQETIDVLYKDQGNGSDDDNTAS